MLKGLGVRISSRGAWGPISASQFRDLGLRRERLALSRVRELESKLVEA